MDGLDAEEGAEMSWVMRDDFPRSRRGWEREAVLAHLREVEAEMHELASTSRMSGRAAEGVRRVVQAAEETLAELVVEAQEELERAAVEAESIRAAARGDSQAWIDVGGRAAAADAEAARIEASEVVQEARERAAVIVAGARTEAAAHIAEAEGAVSALLSEARAMGRRVEAFGDELERGLAARRNGGPPAESAPTPATGRRRFEPGTNGGTTPPQEVIADLERAVAQPPVAS